ncbi:MAG: ATP-binding protein [Gemmatimonadales bacterium]|nr:ATP-binding protein [Gemmatimonadales bacterium]
MIDPSMESPRRPAGRDHFSLDLATDLSQVGEVVEAVAACCFAGVTATTRTRFRLCTVVAEAVANAMVYGNGNDPTRRVLVDVELHQDRVVVGVTDEGEGFDPAVVPDPTDDDMLESECGRGIFMIRRLADAVSFNARGNTIWMTLPRC